MCAGRFGLPPEGQRQLRLGAALHPSPGPRRLRRLRPGQWQRCRQQPVRARARSGAGDRRGRPGRLHGGACRASFFTAPQIPVCLWFLAKNKNGRARTARTGARDRPLFIDARKLGTLIDRVHRELTATDIAKIADTYHLWRGDPHSASGHPLPRGEGQMRSDLPSPAGTRARG